MDGDPVTEEPSEVKAVSLAEAFQTLCPQYMAMGMSYDEFWNCNTKIHKAYREAYEIRRHDEEWARWRNGLYVYDALLCAAPVMRTSFGKGKVEPGKYPQEPWPLTQKEADEREERLARENYFKAIAQRKAESERRKQMRAEQAAMKEASKDGGD